MNIMRIKYEDYLSFRSCVNARIRADARSFKHMHINAENINQQITEIKENVKNLIIFVSKCRHKTSNILTYFCIFSKQRH